MPRHCIAQFCRDLLHPGPPLVPVRSCRHIGVPLAHAAGQWPRGHGPGEGLSRPKKSPIRREGRSGRTPRIGAEEDAWRRVSRCRIAVVRSLLVWRAKDIRPQVVNRNLVVRAELNPLAIFCRYASLFPLRYCHGRPKADPRRQRLLGPEKLYCPVQAVGVHADKD